MKDMVVVPGHPGGVAGFVALCALLCAGCGGEDGPPPPAIPDIGGYWNWSETYDDPGNGMSCTFVGSIMLAQTGATFGGSWTGIETCATPAGPTVAAGSGAISDGAISGRNVGFLAPPPSWHYQGSVSGDPPDRLDGTLSAAFASGGRAYQYSGAWQATR